jgi:alpha-N-acetylglucosamine transferase
MLQNSLYVGNALVLGHTLGKHNPTLAMEGIGQILLVPFDHDLSPTNLTRLREVGWTIQYEHDVQVEGMETLQRHYQRNFMKLRLWEWMNYTKIGYIDADCLVRGDVRLLVSDAFGKTDYEICLLTLDFGAVQDTWEWVMPAENFNAGVLSITPSLEKFEYLMKAAASTPLQYTAEQGLLNLIFLRPPLVFESDTTVFLRTELPMKFNLNICAYLRHRSQWDLIWPDARVVHFTMVKPNEAEYRSNFPDYEQPVNEWWNEWDEMIRKYNWVD